MNKEILFLSMEDVVECGGANVDLAAMDIQRAFQQKPCLKEELSE